MLSDTAVGIPAPALRPFVVEYAGFRASGAPPGVHAGLPSAQVHLLISLGPPIELVRMPDPAQRPDAFQALASGLQHGPAMVRMGGTAHGLHVFLRPLGAEAILGVPSVALASRVIHLYDIWPDADRLVDRLMAASSWPQRFAILDRALLSRLRPAKAEPEIAWAWQRLSSAHGAMSVRQLAEETGWSQRHFRDRFRQAAGVTPKAAARVFRFQRACRLIMDAGAGLAHTAAACGYSDQAHMTRDWHALAGCSPREWIARDLPFLQDYEVAGRDNDTHELDREYRPRV